ncbi:ABC transporter substrate-binding protein [Vibrio sonorensis]|uniref:ABC transporter substrate-binding protein n=1 Tax=Vibrio sonorensis TaxID=1004316 RepID=UPI0008DADA18|nr:extracellular solute-binding protein [Vibrio sonorensis]
MLFKETVKTNYPLLSSFLTLAMVVVLTILPERASGAVTSTLVSKEIDAGKPTKKIQYRNSVRRNKVVSVLLPYTHVQAGRLLAKEFKELTGISVLIQRYDYKSFDLNNLKGKGDVIVFPILYTERLVKDEWLLALDNNPDLFKLGGLGAPISRVDFLDNFWKSNIVDGSLFAIPFDGDTHFIIYRRSWFESLGIEAPRSWQEFNQTSEAIERQIPQAYGTTIMAFPSDFLVLSGFFNRYFASGAAVFDSNKNLVFDWSVAHQSIQQLIDLKPSAMRQRTK